MIRRSKRCEHRVGDRRGREDTSVIASPARYRDAHLDAVAGETWNRSAARLIGQPSSTIS
jgi:hypothetical protein